MSEPTTFHLKPAPAHPAHSRGTAVRLCSFPKSQRRGGKRYLHPDGETVVCRTSEERRWWIAMIRSGDVIKVEDKAVTGKAWDGPEYHDRGSENVPDLVDAGPTNRKKGRK